MKPTKEIINLINKRQKYGELVSTYDGKIMDWCEEHGIDDTKLSQFGCMLTAEPDSYAEMTLKLIEDTEQN